MVGALNIGPAAARPAAPVPTALGKVGGGGEGVRDGGMELISGYPAVDLLHRTICHFIELN